MIGLLIVVAIVAGVITYKRTGGRKTVAVENPIFTVPTPSDPAASDPGSVLSPDDDKDLK